MCCGCWQEVGSPKIDNPNVRELARVTPDIYDFGHLHIIVDDWNCEDSHVEFCAKEVEGNTKNESEIDLKREREYIALLRKMSEPERYSALAIESGCWKP